MVARVLTYSLNRFLASTVTQNHILKSVARSASLSHRVYIARNERQATPRNETTAYAHIGDGNLTHLASPGPSGIAWNVWPNRDCVPCRRFPANNCVSPRETAHRASPSWTNWSTMRQSHVRSSTKRARPVDKSGRCDYHREGENAPSVDPHVRGKKKLLYVYIFIAALFLNKSNGDFVAQVHVRYIIVRCITW